jgi:cytochrome c peroxidase
MPISMVRCYVKDIPPSNLVSILFPLYKSADGSYGPILVRLAWHAAGTYDKTSHTGGSNGATMRFDPEKSHGANKGLDKARALLEPIKKKYPSISYADLWSLAGVVAIQEMGGPQIKWRGGRTDAPDGKSCTPDGRLPNAAKKTDHLRDIFYRMGFNDQEIVALSGAHCLGRSHETSSGFIPLPWTYSPITFTNDYYTLLLDPPGGKWKKVTAPNGNPQFVDSADGSLMMLVSDLALIEDPATFKYVKLYADNKEKFFDDFAAAFGKLLELGLDLKSQPITINRS